MLPNRIVLSRKGCDGKYGKCPSFIFDDEMLSIPIPETHFISSTTYADLKLPQALRKSGRKTFTDLINTIPMKKRVKSPHPAQFISTQTSGKMHWMRSTEQTGRLALDSVAILMLHFLPLPQETYLFSLAGSECRLDS